MSHSNQGSVASQVESLQRQFAQAPGLPFGDLMPTDLLTKLLQKQDIVFNDRIYTPLVTLAIFLKYLYPMPGDENIRRSELYVFNRDNQTLVNIERKWKDESYSDLYRSKASADLRFLRTDHPVRNISGVSHEWE